MKLLNQIRLTIIIFTIASCLLIACLNDTSNAQPLPQPDEGIQEVAGTTRIDPTPQPMFPYTQDDEVDQASPGVQPEYTEFIATAYCSCPICCGKYAYNRPNGIVYGASGRELIEGYSIAVDPSVIPYGSVIKSEDGTEYRADDCGGAIKGNHIDIYFADHQKALKWGKQTIKLDLAGVNV